MATLWALHLVLAPPRLGPLQDDGGFGWSASAVASTGVVLARPRLLVQARVQRVAQAIADQVERERREVNGKAGNEYVGPGRAIELLRLVRMLPQDGCGMRTPKPR